MTEPRALHLGDAYRLLFEASPDGIAWLGSDNRLAQVNQTLCDLIGATRGELVGRVYGQCCPVSEHERIAACLEAAREGCTQQMRHDLHRADGTRFAVDARFIPLVVEEEVRALCVIWRDLSAERHLRERADLLEAGLAHLNQIVMITKAEPLDEPGPEIVYVNPALERITGHAPEEVIGRSPRFLQGEDTQRQALDELREALRARRPAAMELLNYKKSGQPFRMQIDIAPVFDDTGRCTHFAAIEHDVTPQHRAVERDRLAATALNRTDEGVMVLDAQGRATLVNDAFTAITGYGASEMIGRVPRLDPEHKDQTLFDEIKARIDDSGSWRGELWARRRDGSAYPVLTRVTQGSNGEGITHYIIAFQDISQRKDTEARLQYLSSHDELTRLPNRLLIQDRTDKCIDHAKRRGGQIAMLFLDVDRFKQINDSLGHKAGDELLRLAAARLQSAVRQSDTVARMGGDEFTVLLDD
ncbi:MAG TPA: PAS domain S-box protein, partial [Gammaproteobacteria bacterium]|nr:PAS domain S-box protein [Gammaproteobacteria bacterium]